MARNQYSRTTLWLKSLTVTPDARGDVIETLRGRRDFPAQIPNRMYLYRFVRDKFKKAQREHLDAAGPLYDEYKVWCDAQAVDDRAAEPQHVQEVG